MILIGYWNGTIGCLIRIPLIAHNGRYATFKKKRIGYFQKQDATFIASKNNR